MTLGKKNLITIIHALVTSRLDYRNVLYYMGSVFGHIMEAKISSECGDTFADGSK